MNTPQDGIIKALETLIQHGNALKEHKRNETMIEKTLEMHEHKLNLLCGTIMTLSQELIKLNTSKKITFGAN